MIWQSNFYPARFLKTYNHGPVGSNFIENVRAVGCFVFHLQGFAIDRSGSLRELYNNAAIIGGFWYLQSADLILRD